MLGLDEWGEVTSLLLRTCLFVLILFLFQSFNSNCQVYLHYLNKSFLWMRLVFLVFSALFFVLFLFHVEIVYLNEMVCVV